MRKFTMGCSLGHLNGISEIVLVGWLMIVILLQCLTRDKCDAFSSNYSTFACAPTQSSPYLCFFKESRQIIRPKIHANITLRCYARGNPKPIIEWRRNGKLLKEQKTGSTQITIKDNKLHLTDLKLFHSEGNYSCTAKNEYGQQIKQWTLVTMGDTIILTDPIIKHSPSNTTVFKGQKLVVFGVAYADPLTLGHWYKIVNETLDYRIKTGDNIVANKTHLIIHSITTNDSGRYLYRLVNRLSTSEISFWISVRTRRRMLPSTEIKIHDTSQQESKGAKREPLSMPALDDTPSMTIITIFSVPLAIMVVVLCVLGLFCCRLRVKMRKKDKKLLLPDRDSPPTPDQVSVGSSTRCFKELIRRNQINLLSPIDKGAFGQVFEGVMKDESLGTEVHVAVKMPKDNTDYKAYQEMKNESAVMEKFDSHKNIIRYYGVCIDSGSLLLVMEFAPKGNLRNYLRSFLPHDCLYPYVLSKKYDDLSKSVESLKSPQTDLNVPQESSLIQFALDVANGMEYVASEKIVHRDIAARNILLTANLTCKISDFGLARDVTSSPTEVYTRNTQKCLPIKWMSPEAIRESIFTTKGDVWSFGVLMWEIFSFGCSPYVNVSINILHRLLINGQRLQKPDHARDHIYDIMMKCWQLYPESRPTFSQLVNTLFALNDDKNAPFNNNNTTRNTDTVTCVSQSCPKFCTSNSSIDNCKSIEFD